MRSFVVGIAVLGLLACDSSTANSNTNVLTLEQHQAQWQHRSFHSYSFDCQKFGLGRANAHVIVTNDIVTSVTDTTRNGAPVDTAAYPTVDALFATARTYFHTRHVEVDIQFDSDLGYPTHVSAFAIPSNPGGGYQVSVSNLQPIN